LSSPVSLFVMDMIKRIYDLAAAHKNESQKCIVFPPKKFKIYKVHTCTPMRTGDRKAFTDSSATQIN
jgi:hypothetical protein